MLEVSVLKQFQVAVIWKEEVFLCSLVLDKGQSFLTSVLGPEEGFPLPLSLTKEGIIISVGLRHWDP